MEKFFTKKTFAGLLFLYALLPLLLLAGPVTADDSNEDTNEANKLCIILLDGVRWDYIDEHIDDLPTFSKFLSEGVRAKWVEPVFPAESFPGWTTLATGRYVEGHGILGNVMFDLSETNKSQAVFSFDQFETTKQLRWWQHAEPIWTTATRYGKKVFVRDWSRSDVPVNEVLPKEYSPYYMGEDGGLPRMINTFRVGAEKLKSYDLVMIFGDEIDIAGHSYGPDSEKLKEILIETDHMLHELLESIEEADLEENVNIIIVSDHGMTSTEDLKPVYLDDYLDITSINRVIGYGGYMAIAPYAKKFQSVYNSLQGIEGIDVYKREDIPEELHYKNGRYVQDILLVAQPKYFIKPLQTTKQIPAKLDPNQPLPSGVHGYTAIEDMRTVFMAKGPDFNDDAEFDPIHMVDIYQLYPFLLKIPPQPHNGTWSKVSSMLVNSSSLSRSSLGIFSMTLSVLFYMKTIRSS